MALTTRRGAVLVALGLVALSAHAQADELEQASLVPPSLVSLHPIAWPEGVEATTEPVAVTVHLTIDESGEVSQSEVVEGAGAAFNRLVVRASVLFRFTPAEWEGSPVRVTVPFTHTFYPPEQPSDLEDDEKHLVAELAGIVEERGTRAPVQGATVVVVVDGREHFGTTDEAGKFAVLVPEGQAQVRVASPLHRRFIQQEELRANERLKVRYLVDRQSYSPYETVVTGRRERTEVSRTTLEGRELTHVPGTFGDPFKVIQVLPGVTQVMSLLPLPVVRGSSPGNTGFFLDESRLPLLFHLFGGPSVVHPEFVDRVDFYPGGFPLKFGGYTGGIVNGETRMRQTDNRLDIDLNLLQTGVFLRRNFPSLDLTATVAGRIGYPGALLSLITDDLSLGYWDYQARVDEGNAYRGWTAFVYGASDEIKVAQPQPDGSFALQRIALFRFHRGDARLRLGDEDAHYLARIVVGLDESGVGPRVMTSALVFNPILRSNVRLGRSLRWASGLDGQARRTTTTKPETEDELENTTGGVANENGWLYTAGAFTELQWTPAERFLLVSGVRADYYDDGRARQASVDPRVQARLRLDEDATWLKGSVGLFHQPPRLFVPAPGLDMSALELGLLGSTQASIGIERRLWAGVDLDVQTYFNWMDPVLFDLELNRGPDALLQPDPGAESDADAGEFARRLFTGRQGRSYGLEVMLRKRDSDGLFGWVSYTLSHSERKDSQGQWQAFDFDRAHILNVVAGLKLPRNWEFGTRLLVQTGTPVTTLFGYNAGRTAPQMRVDLRIDKRAVWNSWLLDFYVDVINVVVAEESGGLVGSNAFRYVLPTIGFRAVL